MVFERGQILVTEAMRRVVIYPTGNTRQTERGNILLGVTYEANCTERLTTASRGAEDRQRFRPALPGVERCSNHPPLRRYSPAAQRWPALPGSGETCARFIRRHLAQRDHPGAGARQSDQRADLRRAHRCTAGKLPARTVYHRGWGNSGLEGECGARNASHPQPQSDPAYSPETD